MDKLFKSLQNPIFWILVLILLLGTGLRIYHLTWQDIWYDESVTILAAKMSFTEMFRFTLSPVDITDFPPVYYILMKGWIGLFGDSPPAVRMSSVLCGILSILGMYFVGKSLFDNKHGLWAALFMSVSPFDIYYSQEVRAYALQVFLISLSVYFFLKALIFDNRKMWWTYVLITLFAIYIHFFSSFVWVSLCLFHLIFLWKRKCTFKQISKMFYGQWVIVVGILPVIVFRITGYQKDLVGWVNPFKLPAYRHTLITLLFGVYGNYTHWMYVLGISLFIICTGVSVYYLFKFRKKWGFISEFHKLDMFSAGLLSWILFIFPALIFTAISLTIHQIYVPWRYLIIILPGFILVLTHALYQIRFSILKFLVIVLFLSLFLIMAKRSEKSYFKVGMKSVAEYIKQNEQPGDLVLFIPGYHGGSFFYYYRDREKVHPLEDLHVKDWFEGVYKAPSVYRRAWLVVDPNSARVTNELNIKDFIISIYGNPVSKTMLPPFWVEVYLFEFKKT